MNVGRVRQLVRMAGGFRPFVNSPVSHDQAVADIRQRMENRDGAFVHLARRLIYDIPSSPYRKLLLWAGCEWADLAANVKSRGLEKTLEQLWDAGVFVSLEEFKSRTPIRRPGLAFAPSGGDFDNPYLGGHRLEGATSGSRGQSTRVAYDWEFIAEESAHERLLYRMHGVLDRPTALWFPVPPGIAGVHNLLMSLKIGCVPEKWFSQTPPAGMPLEGRLALQFLRWQARIPPPEPTDLDHAGKVVAWLAETRRRGTPGVVRTFGSSAVRIAQTALETGVDIRGSVLFAGGEPLTDHRRRFIESAGLKVYARYVATESGLVAAACPQCAADEMHFYQDRLAVIRPEESLLFTSLTTHAGKVLLNVELGDRGELGSRRCSCLFGELGFDQHLSNVHSNEKLTVEGMTLLVSELHRAISVAIEAVGGRPDSFQVWQSQDERGLNKLVIAVSPDLGDLNEAKLVGAVLAQLRHGSPGSGLAAEVWQQAATLRIVRQQPCLSPGQKLLPLQGRRILDGDL